MTPKPRTLHQIRRQVAANRRSTASVTNQSAFHRIEMQNERFVHGYAIPRRDPEDLSGYQPKKRIKRQPKGKLKPRPRPTPKTSESSEPEPEYWRPTGGDAALCSEDEVKRPTCIIGVARVPIWTLEAFKKGLQAVSEQYGEVQELMVQHVQDGVEQCADVLAVFRSELVAEVVKDGIYGSVVEGRMLRVRYA